MLPHFHQIPLQGAFTEKCFCVDFGKVLHKANGHIFTSSVKSFNNCGKINLTQKAEFIVSSTNKAKAISLEARTVPEVTRSLRLPDLKKIRT